MNNIISDSIIDKFITSIIENNKMRFFKIEERIFLQTINGFGYKKVRYDDTFSIKITSIYFYNICHNLTVIIEHVNYILVVFRSWPFVDSNNQLNISGKFERYFTGELEILNQHLIQNLLSNP